MIASITSPIELALLNLNKNPHSLNQVVGVAYLWTSYGLGTSISIALFYSFYIKNYLLSYKSHLGKYEKVSGQKINSNKTTLFSIRLCMISQKSY